MNLPNHFANRSSQRFHVTPVGGGEPIHLASLACGCRPVIKENPESPVGFEFLRPEIVAHNAFDGREILEQEGRKSERAEGSTWINVLEEL